MEELWFVLAAVCVVAGLALLWFDRRRRNRRPAPPTPGTEPRPDEGPGDLFRESHPR